jgi:hypothetical protein
MVQGRFAFPTPVLAGPGCIAELAAALEELGVRKPLLVTDPGLLPTPALAAVQKAAGRECPVYSGVQGNPIEADVDGAVAAFREHGCDGVVGVGGGSALDVAKILRARAALPDVALADFYTVKNWPALAPFVAVPTTAGTGSEVGRSSVVTVGGRKQVYFHPSLLAARVFLDPELTLSLPARLTAATGMDALTHCIESFASPVYHLRRDRSRRGAAGRRIPAAGGAGRIGSGGTRTNARRGGHGRDCFPEGSGRGAFDGAPAVRLAPHAPRSGQCALSRGGDGIQRAAQAGALPAPGPWRGSGNCSTNAGSNPGSAPME